MMMKQFGSLITCLGKIDVKFTTEVEEHGIQRKDFVVDPYYTLETGCDSRA